MRLLKTHGKIFPAEPRRRCKRVISHIRSIVRKRLKPWLVWAAGAIAALALVIGNLDNILSTTVKWLGPTISAYVSPRANISIALDDAVAGAADVFIADPANETRAIAVSQTQHGQGASLSVPANVLYTIGWQGAGLQTGAVARVLAVRGEPSFQLVRTGEQEGQITLVLRPGNPRQPEPSATAPDAGLLISAREIQTVAVAPSGALPELDRAASIEGLFETGKTSCARQLFFVPTTGGKAPAVGCLGASIPGWLGEVITALDKGDQQRLDVLVGADAGTIRNYVAQPQTIPDAAALQRAMTQLLSTPEFWIGYQARVLAAYSTAADASRSIGLVSERGRLLMFDQLVRSGPGSVSRAVTTYTNQYRAGASDQPANEQARIVALSGILKGLRAAPGIGRRIDTIVSGHGVVQGVNFDLERLGISDVK